MKKPVLLLLLACFLTGTASAQMFDPNKKKKKKEDTQAPAGKQDAGKGGAAAPAPTALPTDFDPKIVTDSRSHDVKPREKPAGSPADGKFAKNASVVEEAMGIAKAQLAQGNDKVALEYLDKAVSKNPKNTEARVLRAEVRVKRKMYAEAISDLLMAKKDNKTDPNIYFWMGRAKQGQDKDKEAVASFDQCIQLKPDWADAYYWRGHSYSELDMLKDKACPDYTKAAELGSDLGTKAKAKYCK